MTDIPPIDVPSDGLQPERNRLLGSLPPNEYHALRLLMEPVSLRRDQSLFRAGDRIEHLYFIQAGGCALLTGVADGVSLQTAFVGREGAAGASLINGVPDARAACQVLVSGSALRISAGALEQAIHDCPGLCRVLRAYSQELIDEAAALAACIAIHPLPRRCASRLLSMADRIGTDVLPVSHDTLSFLLCVRRASVTTILQELRRAGVIDYVRGQITLLNRAGLERSACSCHRIAPAEQVGHPRAEVAAA